MENLAEISWLIPSAPLGGGLFLGILLVSFNRTMNRLTKPVSVILIGSMLLADLISFFLVKEKIAGSITYLNINIFSYHLRYDLFLDQIVDKFLLIILSSFLSIMLASFYYLERRVGYVRYFITLSIASSLIVCFIMSGNLFHSIYSTLVNII